MFKKKPWSDGLFPDFDDSFESRFYCFGGDGGGDSGSGGRNEPRQNRYDPADQEPERGFRGEQSARTAAPPTRPTPPPPRPTPPPPPPPEPDPRPMGIADMFPSAVVEPAAPPRTPESPLASFVQPKLGLSGSLDVSDMSVGFGSPNQVYEDAISLGNTGLSVGQGPPSASQTIQGLADKFDVPSSVNIGGYELGFPEDSGMGVELGPGRLEPTLDLQDKSIGLNYKIDIAQQDPQAFARDQALADQNRTQLEYPTIEDRGSLYGRSNPIPVKRKSLYEGLAPSSTGLTLGDFAGPNPIVSLSDLSDSKNFGNPYAGTTGAFVPTRVEVDAQGRTIVVPVGFGAGGIVSLLQPLGDYLTGEIDQQRVDPFLEMVENAAYQEFGIDPSSGGGGMEFVGFKLPGETFGPGQMKPQVGFEEPGKYISGNELTVSTGFLGRPALQDMPQVGGNMAPENQMTKDFGGEQRMTGNMAEYRQAQEDARRQREAGFMGRVMLPGEGSFEDFMNMRPQVNLLQDSPTPFQAQFQSAFGGIGSLF